MCSIRAVQVQRWCGAWAVVCAVGIVAWAGSSYGAIAMTNPPTHSSVMQLSPQAGPWLIIVSAFTGPNAAELAHDLAQEIQTEYRLPAYVFDRSSELRAAERARVEALRKERREAYDRLNVPADTPLGIKTVRIEDQFAVLVGGYKDMDTARRALDAIKKMKAPSERFRDTQFVKVVGENGQEEKIEKVAVNPFERAFVVPNPTVKRATALDPNEPDPAWRELNAGESLSVLKCPKPWTLVVKTFEGGTILQTDSSRASSMWSRVNVLGTAPSRLNTAAQQARNLAELLRKLGFESYVFHTRYQSIVTVGNYDRVDDPRLAQMQRTISNLQLEGLDPSMQLIRNPVPMQIPRFQ